LPDGLFSYQKIPIWIYFGGPWNGKCWYIWCWYVGYLEYFITIWYFCGHYIHFSPFWYIVTRKIWQPWPQDLFQSWGSSPFAGLIYYKIFVPFLGKSFNRFIVSPIARTVNRIFSVW
jgi:hypothetical protein